MTSRRSFLLGTAGVLTPAAKSMPRLSSKERVDRSLNGNRSTDRPPFSFWHHFGLEKEGPESHARATVSFHRRFHTDLVKVMSDFPFPESIGKWFEITVRDNPFPAQIRALELIREGVGGDAYFVETIFNPWNVAEKLSSPREVQRLKQENPKALANALEVIARSEANHARRAMAAGPPEYSSRLQTHSRKFSAKKSMKSGVIRTTVPCWMPYRMNLSTSCTCTGITCT